MRAVRFHGVGVPLAVEEVDRPRPGPGEVEVAGVVAELGEGVSAVAVGDRVAVHHLHACHRCRWCLAGDDHLCDAPLGFLAFATDGGFAEQLAVPASAVVPVPEGVDLPTAATRGCHPAGGPGALRRGTARPVLVGSGPWITTSPRSTCPGCSRRWTARC